MAILLVWLIWFRWQRRSASIGLLAEHTGVLVETPRERRFAGVRTVVGAAVILVVAGVAGTAAAIVLPARVDRQVVRTAIEQPFDPRAYASPLSGFRNYLEPAESDRADADRERSARRPPHPDRHPRHLRRRRLLGRDRPGLERIRIVHPGAVPSRTVGRRRRQGRDLGRGARVLRRVGARAAASCSRSPSPAATRRRSPARSTTTTRPAPGAVTRGLRAGDAYTLDAVVKPQLTPAQLVDAQPGTASVPKPAVVPDELTQTLQKYSPAQTTPGRSSPQRSKGLAGRRLHQPRHRARTSRSAVPATAPTASPSSSPTIRWWATRSSTR